MLHCHLTAMSERRVSQIMSKTCCVDDCPQIVWGDISRQFLPYTTPQFLPKSPANVRNLKTMGESRMYMVVRRQGMNLSLARQTTK
jgi:hypothetical protein